MEIILIIGGLTVENIDLDNSKLMVGDRVVAIDRVNGFHLKIGTVVGFTPKQAKVKFENDPKIYGKQLTTIAKVWKQG